MARELDSQAAAFKNRVTDLNGVTSLDIARDIVAGSVFSEEEVRPSADFWEWGDAHPFRPVR